jgi:hypothetical protein
MKSKLRSNFNTDSRNAFKAFSKGIFDIRSHSSNLGVIFDLKSNKIIVFLFWKKIICLNFFPDGSMKIFFFFFEENNISVALFFIPTDRYKFSIILEENIVLIKKLD